MTRPFRRGLTACLLLLALPALALRAEEEGGGPAAPEPHGIQALVEELRPIVADIRGLPWKHDVPAKVLSREALRAFMKEQFEKEVTPEELARDIRIVRRLGLVGPDEDIVELQMMMLEQMIAGVYDPETKELYLIEGFEGEAQKPTLVHELIHALDDQHFDLLGLEKPYRKDDPDRQFAIRCLFEGSAELGRRLFQDRDPAAARSFYEQSAGDKDQIARQKRVLGAVPAHMVLASMLHYRMGPHFVTQAVGSDFKGGMQRLFEDQPTTQEQILHPHKWLGPARDYPRTVVWGADFAAVAGEGWKKLDEHSVGELDFAAYLDYFLGGKNGRLDLTTLSVGRFVSPMASRAAAGWDAGRIQYLDSPDGRIAVIVAYAFDSDEEAAEAANFLGAALRKASGEAWKGRGWTFDENGSGRTFAFDGRHGHGRILQRGREVLLLEGAPPECFDALWTALGKTSFTQDERDRGDVATDPFEGFGVVDRQRGLGLALPAGWRGEANDRIPISFADASNGPVQVNFLVVDQAVSAAGLPKVAKGTVLGPLFDEKALTPARVMGGGGVRHPMPAPPGHVRTLYLGSDATRLYIVIVSGARGDVTAAQDDIQRLLDGMPPAGTSTGESAVAGIRSIPGY